MYPAPSKNLDKIIEKFSPIVQREAHRIHRSVTANVEIGDLVQAGFLGLIDAQKTYKPNSAVPFEGYLTKKVRWAIYDELRNQDWMSTSVRTKINKLDAAISKATQKTLDGKPSEDAIAQELGMDIDEYREMYDGVSSMQFTEMASLSADDYAEQIEDENAEQPEKQMLSKQHRSILIDGIKNLPEREALIISLYYEEELTYREIAEILEVSVPRINQLHAQALSRIRANFS